MNLTTDLLYVSEGLITRSKVKKIEDAYTLHLRANLEVETKIF